MKNQKQFIIKHLNEFGEISRNFCLQNFISRLGSYICIMQKEGWKFTREHRNGDYIYKVTSSPDSSAKLATTEPHNSPRNDLNHKNDIHYIQPSLLKIAPKPLRPYYEYN